MTQMSKLWQDQEGFEEPASLAKGAVEAAVNGNDRATTTKLLKSLRDASKRGEEQGRTGPSFLKDQLAVLESRQSVSHDVLEALASATSYAHDPKVRAKSMEILKSHAPGLCLTAELRQVMRQNWRVNPKGF